LTLDNLIHDMELAEVLSKDTSGLNITLNSKIIIITINADGLLGFFKRDRL